MNRDTGKRLRTTSPRDGFVIGGLEVELREITLTAGFVGYASNDCGLIQFLHIFEMAKRSNQCKKSKK